MKINQCSHWDSFDQICETAKRIPGVQVTIGTLQLFRNMECTCKRCEQERQDNEDFRHGRGKWQNLEAIMSEHNKDDGELSGMERRSMLLLEEELEASESENEQLKSRVKDLEDKLYNYYKNLAGSKADLDYECLQIFKKREST